jgi:octanoyl-[GcvH]:protein N-octanoyltransferase
VSAADTGQLRLVRESFPDRPAFGAAVSRAILLRVAAGELPPTMRLHRTGRVLAFGRRDAAADRFGAAVRAAREAGFQPIVRLAGGQAALYHEGTIALSQATPDPRPAARTHARFERLAKTCAAALRRLGVDARVGEVPGEYCPGAWSVNAAGRSKLVGIGQRIISGGAHLGVVIVVRDSGLVRDALVPVYDALGLAWDPATAGSVEDELGSADLAAVEESILRELTASGHELIDAALDPDTLALAARHEGDHRPAD